MGMIDDLPTLKLIWSQLEVCRSVSMHPVKYYTDGQFVEIVFVGFSLEVRLDCVSHTTKLKIYNRFYNMFTTKGLENAIICHFRPLITG